MLPLWSRFPLAASVCWHWQQLLVPSCGQKCTFLHLTFTFMANFSYPKQLRGIHFAGVCVFSGNQSHDFALLLSYATSWNVKIKPNLEYIKKNTLTYSKLYKNNPDLYVFSQGDKGGERVLQKKWTTFLKAQLLCSLPDDGFPFNIIQDMFVLTPSKEAWKSTVFYGVFTSQW